jgi:hypothetical protein
LLKFCDDFLCESRGLLLIVPEDHEGFCLNNTKLIQLRQYYFQSSDFAAVVRHP